MGLVLMVDATVDTAVADNVLIERSWKAPEAFAGIFDRHAEAVHRYLSWRVGRQLADDLMAETFLAAFGQRGRYDQTYVDARPWLYGIATKVLHRQRRTETRQYRALARTGLDPASDGALDGALARVTAGAATRRIAAALARLSVRERDVLLLVAWENLTYTEVAQALDIPVGTVKSRLHSARRRLRARLTDLDPTDHS